MANPRVFSQSKVAFADEVEREYKRTPSCFFKKERMNEGLGLAVESFRVINSSADMSGKNAAMLIDPL